jgi:hypothetical protein
VNDWRAAVEKLEEIARTGIAEIGETDKAALYGAARWLLADLDAYVEEKAPYLGEHIERLRWSIGAILGFDITNGHTGQQHLSWVYGAGHAIQTGLSRSE